MTDINERLKAAVAKTNAMTPEEKEAMMKEQRESFVRAELNWPKAKFTYVDGVKVYASYEDYCND